DVSRAKDLGFKNVNVDFDFSDIMARVHRVIQTIEPHDSVERYTKLGVDCIRGTAKILSPHEIEVNGTKITTKNITIATGAKPYIPPIEGIDNIDVLTSENLWQMKSLPKRLLVLGGGPIGCELAQSFQRLGSQVTLVERNECIMAREDEEVSRLIQEAFVKEGIDLRLGHGAQRFFVENNQKFLECEHRGEKVKIPFDQVIISIGRKANTKGFGLEELGIDLNDNGTIKVDSFLRTTKYKNIYACGDVAGPYQFTHTASHQAWYCAVNAMLKPFWGFKADYRVIPWCTYTDPEVARVGLSESEAMAQGIPFEVSTYGIDDLDRAIADESAQGFVKVLTQPKKDKILGVTIVGSHAGDIIAEYVTAMKYGIGMNKILGTIHIYPTLAEANKFAAGAWKQSQVTPQTLKWAERWHTFRR
ncbi:MAG: FAD-dependent oxidoreductase, partial [Bdellovibrionales bacterium]|nr:FAD-dependent oxidoreductase [Bdellovibrionales bacterium]